MKANEVMKILKIARPTLSKYVKEKKINVSIIKHNNRYLYDPQSVFKLASNDTRTNVIYSRVSTYKQKNQLINQIKKITDYCSINNISINHTYKDISSGLSLNRKDFDKLLNLIIQYKIENVFITNKDRLSRLSFKMIKQLFNKFGTNIICINESNTKTEEEEEELLEELISLLHCFSMKTYSKRRKTKYNIIKKDLILEKIDNNK